uniref:nucleolar protein 16-like n=1 Tax=Myxine glutinosa TaxID=7769 RepID=UPI00358FC5AC
MRYGNTGSDVNTRGAGSWFFPALGTACAWTVWTSIMVKAKRSRRGKKFDYTKNRKKLYRKTKQKMKPHISCEDEKVAGATIREAWDGRKNVYKNMAEMGLAADPNIAFPLSRSNDEVGRGLISHMEHAALSLYR